MVLEPEGQLLQTGPESWPPWKQHRAELRPETRGLLAPRAPGDLPLHAPVFLSWKPHLSNLCLRLLFSSSNKAFWPASLPRPPQPLLILFFAKLPEGPLNCECFNTVGSSQACGTAPTTPSTQAQPPALHQALLPPGLPPRRLAFTSLQDLSSADDSPSRKLPEHPLLSAYCPLLLDMLGSPFLQLSLLCGRDRHFHLPHCLGQTRGGDGGSCPCVHRAAHSRQGAGSLPRGGAHEGGSPPGFCAGPRDGVHGSTELQSRPKGLT